MLATKVSKKSPGREMLLIRSRFAPHMVTFYLLTNDPRHLTSCDLRPEQHRTMGVYCIRAFDWLPICTKRVVNRVMQYLHFDAICNTTESVFVLFSVANQQHRWLPN